MLRRAVTAGVVWLLAACDGGMVVRGVVRDTAGNPVPQADHLLGDRVFNEKLDAFLKGYTDDVGYTGLTAADGTFYRDVILAGPGKHDIWLVVGKEGYETHAQQVWSGKDQPGRDFFIEVVLEGGEVDGAAGAGGAGGATSRGGAAAQGGGAAE